jgi:hypothetical protein
VLNINFFGKAGDIYQKTRKLDKQFLTWSLVGFGSVVVVFLVLLVADLWMGNQLKSIITKENNTKQSLADNQTLEVSFLVFSHKLKSIGEIFVQRNNKQQAINYLSSLFGPEVFISGVTYEGEAQVLSLALTSTNIFELEKLLNSLDTPEVKESFSSLSKSNIKRNEDGSYDLRLTLELKTASESAQPAAKVTP